MGVLVRELAALYAAFAAGPALAAARAAGAVRGLRGLAARAGCRARSLEAQLAYWRRAARRRCRRCSSCPPTGRGRRCRASAAPACRFALPAELRRGAAALGAGARARRLFMVAAGRLRRRCCARYTRPGRRRRRHAGRRPQPGRRLEGLIGFFVNTLVLRGRPRGRPDASASCSAGCARRRSAPTRTRTCRSRSWSRSCSRSGTSPHAPLFQVMFVAAERARRARWSCRA